MDLKFENSFKRDLKKIKDKDILEEIKKLIEELEKIKELKEFRGDLKKLRSGKNFWRIRIGDYRIGLEIEGNILIFVRILPRKEIYKYFP
ncbi:type II toxin-antitoxin system RelE family toxin [Thermodesulfobacterium hydrogeniphilum]|uniref:type II toxin-antitoxin system RelE family toxin n=1 Tax=Thermodesulfobacterium hydrogeniphilum TaxID=161156 RepID=UPI000571FEB1|nr:type II toxin-antitoxin system mRNA interferase toxin, RelE/StbE family [Thermodesulfobacterium hydrogeniphilum]